MWGELSGIRPVKRAKLMLGRGADSKEIIDAFMRLYGVSEQKAELTAELALRETELLGGLGAKDVCLYIGVPFCKSRCLYCSFVTYGAGLNNKMIPDFVLCLQKEIRETAKIINGLNLNIVSIYFGGGTPTMLNCEQFAAVFNTLNEHLNLKNIKEITVEAGRPDTIDKSILTLLKSCGTTRISINPQTMSDKTLEIIGRRHTSAQIVQAVNLAKDCGFDNINMDLIAGLPFETVDDFKRTVENVEKLSPKSITIHTMSVKRGSKLHEKLPDYPTTDSLEVGKMIEYGSEFLKSAGLLPYYLYRQKYMLANLENVGYSAKGCECLYNMMIMCEEYSIISLGDRKSVV